MEKVVVTKEGKVRIMTERKGEEKRVCSLKEIEEGIISEIKKEGKEVIGKLLQIAWMDEIGMVEDGPSYLHVLPLSLEGLGRELFEIYYREKKWYKELLPLTLTLSITEYREIHFSPFSGEEFLSEVEPPNFVWIRVEPLKIKVLE